jgi:hypothetical protein
MSVLTLFCTCGAIEWSLSETAPPSGIRYTCNCDDCQAFAYFTRNSDSVLDATGGTDAYQLPASQLKVARGLDQLACVQVTTRALLRWHCAVCMTPIANTYGSSKLSFLSVPLCTVPLQNRLEVFGPSSGHVWTKFGWGDLSSVKQVSIPAMLWRIVVRIIVARITGDYRNNPLFNRDDGRPIAVPRHLSRSERFALDEMVRVRASA